MKNKLSNKIYSIEFISDENRIIFKGTLKLKSAQKYYQIMNFIYGHAVKSNDRVLVLDIINLQFLNSSGIASLGIFMVKLRDKEIKVRLIGLKFVNWQVILLQNLQELNSNVDAEYVVQH